MNYCAVGEAFDNSLKNQVVEYERNNKNNDNIISPGTFDTYNSVETHEIFPAFFTAQGDYSNKGPYYEGTPISDLKTMQPEDSENLSFLDSENSTKITKDMTKVIDHN